MNNWISKIKQALPSSSPTKTQTLPARLESGEKSEPKKRGFFTLKKK